jgi:hypothetical protein
MELTEYLLKRSRRAEVAWKELNATAFYAKIADYYFQIESEDNDGNHPYRVQIEESSPQGGTEVLTHLSTSDEPSDAYFLVTNWKSTIAELYVDARRRGSSIERALDEMLERAKGDAPLEEGDMPF